MDTQSGDAHLVHAKIFHHRRTRVFTVQILDLRILSILLKLNMGYEINEELLNMRDFY